MSAAIHVPTVAWDIMRLKLAAESWETLGVEEQLEISGYIGTLVHWAHFSLPEKISVPALLCPTSSELFFQWLVSGSSGGYPAAF